MKRFIMFLIRKRLGLGLCEEFRFANQKSDAVYWFTKDYILKQWNGHIEHSGVSLNWLLDDECEIEKV